MIKDIHNRRDFLKRTGLFIGAGLTLPVLNLITTSCDQQVNMISTPHQQIAVKISDYPALANVGGSAMTTPTGIDPNFPIIVIRRSQTTFTTLSSKCPHQGCPVDPPSGNTIFCACHGSIFSATDGSVQKGPSTSGLSNYANSFDSVNGIITISV